MKAILLLILAVGLLRAEDKPTVEVYLIRKYDPKSTGPDLRVKRPGVILEVTNPTQQTLYVSGYSISSPSYEKETLHGDKWLLISESRDYLAGDETFPVRPGTKMLVTVDYPWAETVVRYRLLFGTLVKGNIVLVSVRTRSIDRKEFGNVPAELLKQKTVGILQDLMTDEERRKRAELYRAEKSESPK